LLCIPLALSGQVTEPKLTVINEALIQVLFSNSCELKVFTIAGEYGAVHSVTASEIFGRG